MAINYRLDPVGSAKQELTDAQKQLERSKSKVSQYQAQIDVHTKKGQSVAGSQIEKLLKSAQDDVRTQTKREQEFQGVLGYVKSGDFKPTGKTTDTTTPFNAYATFMALPQDQKSKYLGGTEKLFDANTPVNARGEIVVPKANVTPVAPPAEGIAPGLNPQQQAAAEKQQAIEKAGPTSPSLSVSNAFSPTPYSVTAGLADLQKNVMTADANAKANDDWINGAFKAFHKRDATPEELAAYRGKPVGASRTEIIGGAQVAGLGTVKPGTVAVPTGVMTREEATAQGLQKVLRPDQLAGLREDQIIRDNQGGIWLNGKTTTQAQRDSVASGTSGNQLATPDVPVVGEPTAPAEAIEKAAKAPSAKDFVSTTSNENASAADLSATINDTASNYLSSAIGFYDGRLAKLDAQLAQNKADMGTLTGRLQTMSTTTPNADALEAAREAEGLREKQAKLVTIETQIASERERLQLGLINEGNKLAPLSILGNRQATLQAQGLARIGALTAIAQVFQGDLEFAKDMVNATVTAVNADRTMQLNLIDTLISLKDKEIVQLTDEEGALIKARRDAINEAMDNAQKDADRIFDLIKNNPDAAMQGGVSLTDSAAVALSKMAPHMAAADAKKTAAAGTEVIDLGGRKVLIDSVTGKEIQSYGTSQKAGDEGTFKDITSDDGTITRIFLDSSGRPTGEKTTLTGADTSQKLAAFQEDLATAITDLRKTDNPTSWGVAWDTLHIKYPDLPNAEIDRKLTGNLLNEANGMATQIENKELTWKKAFKQLKESYPYVPDKLVTDMLNGDFNKVGLDTNAEAMVTLASKFPKGSDGGQCGRFVNQNTGFRMGNTYESKMAYTDKSIKVPKSGDVFVMPYDWTGHTGFVDEPVFNTDGKFTGAWVLDSNYHLDEKVDRHFLPASKMSGFARPT